MLTYIVILCYTDFDLQHGRKLHVGDDGVEDWKKKNLAEVFGGMVALLGMFLPYVEGISFFQSLSGPFAVCLTLLIAFAAVLYALGLAWFPHGLSLAILAVCLLFPGYACRAYGFGAVLTRLRAGAWVLLAGLLLMAVSPFCRVACRKKSKT